MTRRPNSFEAPSDSQLSTIVLFLCVALLAGLFVGGAIGFALCATGC